MKAKERKEQEEKIKKSMGECMQVFDPDFEFSENPKTRLKQCKKLYAEKMRRKGRR